MAKSSVWVHKLTPIKAYADVLDSCYHKGHVTSPRFHLPPEAVLELEDQTKCFDHANLRGLCLGDILGQTADRHV